MKRMLLSVLLFAASVIMAQAQGFRVYRSDGAVYEFSVVADSIVFFDGEGDPNYQEPVPDYVLDAIAKLETECAWLKTVCADNRTDSYYNSEMIKDLDEKLLNFEADLQRVRVYCDEQIAQTKLYVINQVYQNLADIQTQSDNNSDRISNLEANLQKSQDKVYQTLVDIQTQSLDIYSRISVLEAALSAVTAKNADIYARVAALEANVYNFKENLQILVERDAQKDAMIKALSERISALEAKVNQ